MGTIQGKATFGGLSTQMEIGNNQSAGFNLVFEECDWDSIVSLVAMQTVASGIYKDVMSSTIQPVAITILGYWRSDFDPFITLPQNSPVKDIFIDLQGDGQKTLKTPYAVVQRAKVGAKVGGLIPWGYTLIGNWEYYDTSGNDVGGQDV